jgi:hypothetical protein
MLQILDLPWHLHTRSNTRWPTNIKSRVSASFTFVPLVA